MAVVWVKLLQAVENKKSFEDASCGRCGGGGLLIDPEGNWAHAQLCECIRYCKECKNRGRLLEKNAYGQEFAKWCRCALVRQAMERYNLARVPSKYAYARLDSDFKDEQNKQAFSTLKLLAEQYHTGHKGILLMGPAGVGKTWLSAAFIHELIVRRCVPVVFRDFFHLLSDLKSGYSQGLPEGELISPLVEVEVLVVDELGKGRNTPWEQNILDTVISHRYNASRMCVFTTNYTTKRGSTLAEHLRPAGTPAEAEPLEMRETLCERVGSRIYSRLLEMCDFIHLSGADRRDLSLESSAKV